MRYVQRLATRQKIKWKKKPLDPVKHYGEPADWMLREEPKIPIAVKVISFWTGKRRSNAPQGVIDGLKKIKYIVKQERELDHGESMDLIIVNSINSEALNSEVMDYLNSLNGTLTKNGMISVMHRYNHGLSFGNFNYVFNLYKNVYKYFWFSEDDYIVTSSNVLKESIDRLNDPQKNIGFVSTHFLHGDYAVGGTGITSTGILLNCHGENLPWNDGDQKNWKAHQQAERQLTHGITAKGYELCVIDNYQNRRMVWS
tara:strand:- start:1320 stop:2087 length:768 start_codon:yes stop_codon:yes gene_type:complete